MNGLIRKLTLSLQDGEMIIDIGDDCITISIGDCERIVEYGEIPQLIDVFESINESFEDENKTAAEAAQ